MACYPTGAAAFWPVLEAKLPAWVVEEVRLGSRFAQIACREPPITHCKLAPQKPQSPETVRI